MSYLFKIISIVFVLLISSRAHAQQLPQYTQWFWHQFALNPAHAGIKPCADIRTLFRTQWVGIDGAPNSGLFTLTAPLFAKRKSFLSARQGIGGKFERDQIGPFTANRFNLSYAGHFNFSVDNRLSIGISAGFQQWVFDKTKTTTLVPDPAIAASNSVLTPDATLGVWWNGKNYYLGGTLQQLPRSKWDEIGLESRFRMQAQLNGGLRWTLREGMTLLPVALLKIPPAGPVAMDIDLMLDLKNQFCFGIGYRNTDALMAFFQVKFKEQFAIAYSFDYVLSPIGQNGHQSHEISIGYSACKVSGRGKTSCPLFE
jgi:type IX secretion system PorP/SprF family membrane protein